MHLCSLCGKKTQQGKYTNKNLFVCVNCMPFFENYHFNTFKVIDDKVVIISPFDKYDEANQRVLFIDYCYKLFNNILNAGIYKLIIQYRKKGYTYLGMIRTMEYFYTIKKNSIAKAKNSIGIIPYIYEEANKYYDYIDKRNYKKYKENFEQSKEENTLTIIQVDSTKVENQNLIDLNTM